MPKPVSNFYLHLSSQSSNPLLLLSPHNLQVIPLPLLPIFYQFSMSKSPQNLLSLYQFLFQMSFSHTIPRDPYTSLIRSRYPQVHSNSCRCTTQPPNLKEVQSLKTQNMLLRSRMTQGLGRGERELSEDKLRFMEIQNKKLHDKITNYQNMMEELERTHMELVNMVKAEHSQRLQHSSRTPGVINQSSSQSNHHHHSHNEPKLDGEYLVSLRKVKRNDREQSRSPQDPQEYSLNFESTQKKGLKNSLLGYSERKHYSPEGKGVNPQNQSQNRTRGPNIEQSELKRAHEKIKDLQSKLEQKSKIKTQNRIISNENQNLKVKVRNIEESIKSYQESIKHYQAETNRLKILIEELKSKDRGDTVTNRQNDSLKNSNEYLKEQIGELEMEIDKERLNNQKLMEEIEKQILINHNLKLECEELNLFAREADKQKRTISLLNQDLERKSSQLQVEQGKVFKYQNILREILEIRQMVEKVDIEEIITQQKKMVHQYSMKQGLLNNQVGVLTSQVERLRQEILILEEKIGDLNATKELLTSSLLESRKENETLGTQIRNLEESIERYLQQPLPTVRVSMAYQETRKESGETLALRETKESIDEVINRLAILEDKMHHSELVK